MRLVFIGIFLMGISSYSSAQDQEDKKIENQSKGSLKTQHSFDDFLVQGKFHFSDQTVVTVEEDKVLDGLVRVRKDFKDRIKDLE